MSKLSLEELRRLIRKLEFNKTEPELLVDLVNRAKKRGESEKERLTKIKAKSHELFNFLRANDLICPINIELTDALRRTPIGSVDGSFQITGGMGGKWYAVYGISQIIAKEGFTLNPTIRVDGNIELIEAVDEGEARKKAEILMMLGEIKGFRMVAEELFSNKDSYLLIDGPIIDPPLYANDKYVEDRVNALKFCNERHVNVVGFVKRVMGNSYLNFLKDLVGREKISEFTNDLDLLSTIMFNAMKKISCPVFTYPLGYDEDEESKFSSTYRRYREKGLRIYYSYYKPNLRSRIFRVEYASFKEINEREVFKEFHKIMGIINRIWTLPGMNEPLLITIAHNKCNVRK